MSATKEGASSERWFGMRLTPAQKAEIEHLAERKGITQKEAVLEAVQRELKTEPANGDERPVEVREGSFLDGVEDLIGSVEGPGDLSSNPEHLKGYGAD